MTTIEGFTDFPFASDAIEHTVYRTGEGPPVLVMHEMPGLSPTAVGFATRLAAAGFIVYLLLALRFATDRLCPAERMARLRSVFGDRLDVHTLESPGVWRTLTSPPHATLTEEYDRAPEGPGEPTRLAFARVVE